MIAAPSRVHVAAGSRRSSSHFPVPRWMGCSSRQAPCATRRGVRWTPGPC